MFDVSEFEFLVVFDPWSSEYDNRMCVFKILSYCIF